MLPAEAAAPLSSGAALAMGSKSNVPPAPTVKLVPSGKAADVRAISVPPETVVPPVKLSLPPRINVPSPTSDTAAPAADWPMAPLISSVVPAEATTARLSAKTTGADIPCVPLVTRISAVAAVPPLLFIVSVPPEPAASV